MGGYDTKSTGSISLAMPVLDGLAFRKTIFRCKGSLRMSGSQEKTRRLGKAVATLASSNGFLRVCNGRVVCEALCHLDFLPPVRNRPTPRGGFCALASAVNSPVALQPKRKRHERPRPVLTSGDRITEPCLAIWYGRDGTQQYSHGSIQSYSASWAEHISMCFAVVVTYLLNFHPQTPSQ